MVDVQQLRATQHVLEEGKPTGDWATKPAVPATGVDATNNSGYPMFVEVTGGTVTAVKVDSVTVGSRTSGLFYVRNGSKIQWTGTGAPTWQWFYA